MPAKPLPAYNLLHECLTYDPATGVFLWKVRPDAHFSSAGQAAWWNTKFACKPAGTVHQGGHCKYIRISINNSNYRAHRVAWKMMTGDDPKETIDHRNVDSLDNRWSNLREASEIQQHWNTNLQNNNISGYRGVSYESKYQLRTGRTPKWRANIQIDGRTHHLGTFATPEDAAAAYETRARSLRGDFYRK